VAIPISSGYSNAEIAAKLGLRPRKIADLLAELRDELRRLDDMALLSACPRHGLHDPGPCRECAREREARRKRGTTTARGYGAAHRRLRLYWARQIEQRTVACARCKQPIDLRDDWDLDHTDDRRGYLGPSHAECNRGASSDRRDGFPK
jgi:hypothetical protein